jgi:hypothetical protein
VTAIKKPANDDQTITNTDSRSKRLLKQLSKQQKTDIKTILDEVINEKLGTPKLDKRPQM